MDAAAALDDLPAPAADRIRNAATVILIDRDRADGPSVLMGMRGAGAAFLGQHGGVYSLPPVRA